MKKHYNVGKNNFMFGKHHSKETIQKMCLAKLGMTSHRKGKNLTEEYGEEKAKEISKKISETRKKGVISGKIVSWNKGKKGLQIAWNKGLTKKDPRVMKYVSKMFGEKHLKGLSLNKKKFYNETKEGKALRLIQSKRFSGEGNPAWNNGSSFEPYGIEFNRKLRQEVKERDDKVCKICKLNEEQLQFFHKRKKNIFRIHHIDYNKKNNKKTNLLNTCVSCHGVTNFNREYWKKELRKLVNVAI